MEKIELTKEEYEKVKHLLKIEEKKYASIEELVGEIIFIRTVTHYYTGRLMKVSGQFAILEDASWIADTGRFSNFMKGQPNESLEVEPMGTTMINIDSIIDISLFQILLTDQK